MKHLTAVLTVMALACLLSLAFGDISPYMSYQGVLRDGDGNVVPDGSHNITFRLYEQSVGGSPIWSETQYVQVEGGLMNVLLGSVTPLNTLAFDVPYWLGVSVEAEAELVPRTELTTVPYAGHAGHADTAARADTADFAWSTGGDSDWTISGDDMYAAVPGGVGIGDTTPEWLLDIHEAGASNNYLQLTNAVTGDATYTGLLVGVSGAGSGWVSFSGGEALHLGRGSATNSVSVHSDGDVSIGLISDPDGKLDVDGRVNMRGFKMPTGAFSGAVLMSDSDGVGSWQPFLSAPPAGSALGTVVLGADGEARVELPSSLAENVDLHYQLTCIGGFAPVYVAEKARGGVFVIAGGEPGMEVSWQVMAAR